MEPTTVTREFVLHWGEMGSRWGVNRTVAQVHALLYLWPEPLTAEDIADALTVARSTSAPACGQRAFRTHVLLHDHGYEALTANASALLQREPAPADHETAARNSSPAFE